MVTQQPEPEDIHSSASPARLFSAKTQVPKPGELIFRRKRLLVDIDNSLHKGHLWIAGPPGTGKTVLAAQYADQSSLQAAWYELDELDTDLVSFFSCFPKTFAAMLPDFSSAVQSLPAFLPEDQLALSIFARKFFRSLFAMLPVPWLLLLDNCQEIPGDLL